MAADRRTLTVVSNRGPIHYDRADGERVARRGSGGLVSALRGLIGGHDVTWIACAISDEDRAVAAERRRALRMDSDAPRIFRRGVRAATPRRRRGRLTGGGVRALGAWMVSRGARTASR